MQQGETKLPRSEMLGWPEQDIYQLGPDIVVRMGIGNCHRFETFLLIIL
jgi:hypothetical protein